MSTCTLPRALAGAVIAIVVAATPAAAIDHTWVATFGSGTACTRSAPCNTFVAAYNATAAGGLISVLDSGYFGAFTIGKSITVRAEGVEGGDAAIGNGAWVTVNAGATDIVRLEGLRFDGGGIKVNTAGQVHIRNCVITNNGGSPPTFGFGINFAPNVPSRLVVTNTAVVNNGTNPTGAGILIQPQPGGGAQVHLERVSAEGNVFGIVADGSGSAAGINVTIADSVASGNRQDGIIAVTPGGGAPIAVLVTNTKSTNNAIGIRSLGPNVTVRVKNSDIVGNGTGLSFGSGGALLTFGNNAVQANGANGAFSGSVGLQ